MPTCTEIYNCVNNYIDYYRRTGRRDPANVAGPALRPALVSLAASILVLLKLA